MYKGRINFEIVMHKDIAKTNAADQVIGQRFGEDAFAAQDNKDVLWFFRRLEIELCDQITGDIHAYLNRQL